MMGRSQDAYDRFSAAVDLPLAVLALLWLPVLVVPLVVRLPRDLATTCNLIGYLVWAAFVVEYLVKLWLTPHRRTFVTHHLVDLAVIVVPHFDPYEAFGC